VGSAGEPLAVGALVAEEGQGEVESFDLAVPSLGLGLLPAADQVGFYLVEAGEHSGVYAQDGTPDAGVFMLARRAIRPAAGAELHFALVEVIFEFGPFCVGGQAVLLWWAQGAAAAEECLVVADEIVIEDGDIPAGGLD
jgi:hypothetical protein